MVSKYVSLAQVAGISWPLTGMREAIPLLGWPVAAGMATYGAMVTLLG